MRDLLSKLVLTRFPPVKYGIGYGSAVFKQANYQAPDLVVDMILVVEDTKLFHKQNMMINYVHYSYLPKRLPL